VVSTRTGCRRIDDRLARDGSTDALAGLRHPAATSETMASPAIQAEAVVSSVIDTQPEMVVTPDPAVSATAVRAPSTVHRLWAIPLVVIAFATVTALLLASMLSAGLVATNARGVEAPYARVPAEAQAVGPRLSFDAVERHEPDGELLFVTVRQPQVTLLDHFIGRDQREITMLSDEDVNGLQTPTQRRQVNLQLMRTAKETAEYVALTKLGYPAELIPGAIVVADVLCIRANEAGDACEEYTPAGDLLEPGDQLLEVDGVELEVLEDLDPIVQSHEPGDRIEIELERPGVGRVTGEVELIASPNDPDRTLIGFQPLDTSTAEIPFEVSIDSDEIGGPSAGLAFTLALLDELTPGELTGNHRVAVTGTIAIDGSVGPIGGLAAKTSAVKQEGATVLLVPTAQGEEDIARARAIAGDDLIVIAVDTLDDALAALASIGGNGLELGTPGADFEES